MDVILQRFPVAVQDIFKQLDDKSLANCREVSKICRNFLDNDSLLWRRRIQKYAKNQVEFETDWKTITRKVSVEILRDLALALEQFFTLAEITLAEDQYSPQQVAAGAGSISLFKYIFERICHIQNTCFVILF